MARKKKERNTTIQFDFRRPRQNVEVVTAFARGEENNPNKGRMSPNEVVAACQAFKDGKAGCPHLYQPVIVEAAQKIGATVATCGRSKSQPSNWNEKQLGPYSEGDVLGETRIHHLTDIRKMGEDGSISEFDGLGTFVVGTDTLSAIHAIHSHRTGNYAVVVACLKQLAFDENQVANLVGRINDDVVDEIVEDGGFLVWNPYQVITWGYLSRKGKRMSGSQIRQMKNIDGVEFEPLAEPIVGRNVSQEELGTAVGEAMCNIRKADGHNAWMSFCGSMKDDAKGFAKMRTNVGTLCRNSPAILNCFGLRNCQLGLPIFKLWEGDSASDSQEVVSIAIGMRLPVNVEENKWEMLARFRGETETIAETIVPSQEVDIPTVEVVPEVEEVVLEPVKDVIVEEVPDVNSPAVVAAEEDGE